MLVSPALRTLSGKTCIVNGGVGQSAVVNYSVQDPRVFVTNVADVYAGTTDTDLTYASFDLFKDIGLEDAVQWAHSSRPNVLFNNVALIDMASVLEANLNQMNNLIDANIRSFFALLKALSQSIFAAKAAMISYTKSAESTLASHGINVNAVSHGGIAAPIWEAIDELIAQFKGKKLEQKKERSMRLCRWVTLPCQPAWREGPCFD